MVVANSRAYDYLEQEQSEQLSKQPKQLPKKNLKKKPKHRVHILNIAFIFAVSVFIISRYAYIAEINFDNKQLDKDIRKAQTENTDLNVQLMKSANLDNLENVAIKELGMQYPDPLNQIIYVQVQEPTAEIAANTDFHGVEDVEENKYLAMVKDNVTNLLKVLD